MKKRNIVVTIFTLAFMFSIPCFAAEPRVQVCCDKMNNVYTTQDLHMRVANGDCMVTVVKEQRCTNCGASSQSILSRYLHPYHE